MPLKKCIVTALTFCLGIAAPGQGLEVKPGTPLHISLEKKVTIRAAEPVRGVLVHPLYVFDREVIPAGSEVSGTVTKVLPASRSERLRTYLNGRLRTRNDALVQFDEIVLRDGRRIPLRASATAGRPSGVVRLAGVDSKPTRQGAINEGRRRAVEVAANHDTVKAARALTTRQSRAGLVRSILGGLKNEALSYWPLGAQHLPRQTAFAAVLTEPLTFDGVTGKLDAVGVAPPPNTLVRARLTHPLTSATARAGSPVRAVTMEPVFSESGALLLPAGTEVRGEVMRAVPARRFGRSGKLQVRFMEFDPGGDTPGLAAAATVEAVDGAVHPGLRLDAEGLASIPVSKKRFIYPAIAAGLATSSVPDAENAVKVHGGAPGWSGFGLAGAGAALASHTLAGPLGWWGVANSTYSNLIRKADELEFPLHTVFEIRLGRSTAAGPILAEAPAGQASPSPHFSLR